MTGRSFRVILATLVAVTPGCATADETRPIAGENPPIVELTIDRVHARMERGELTAESLARAYLRRIEALDQRTRLNAIRTINPHAIEEARALDRKFRAVGRLRPLHGIPIIVKDNIDAAGLATTAGSLAMRYAMPPDDATIISRLRAAGAVVIAKSNMAEWAFSPVQTVGSMFGVTRNPYDLSRVPAGSSGGTAAAIAANFGIVGLGTDTGNSVRGPSAHTGLVGLRPSLGIVSRDGIVPLYLHYDTAGPMCRTVADVARVMDVIAGPDARDPITRHAFHPAPGAFSEALNVDALNGVRIGALRTLFEPQNTDAGVLRLMESALADLAAAGSFVVDVRIPDLEERQDAIWCNTFRYDVNRYLQSLGPDRPVADVADVYNISGLYAPYIGERLKNSVKIEVSPERQSPPCLSVDEDPRRRAFRDYIVGYMDSARVDVLVFPTWAYAARKLWDFETPHGNNSYQIAPHTGFPAITVPMGFTEAGLPVGLQFLGRRFRDVQLVSLAYAYEQATAHRRPPRYPPLPASE